MSEQTEAAALVALYDERIALTKAMANHPQPTGAMAQAWGEGWKVRADYCAGDYTGPDDPPNPYEADQ